jgi:hypothetical protein
MQTPGIFCALCGFSFLFTLFVPFVVKFPVPIVRVAANYRSGVVFCIRKTRPGAFSVSLTFFP